MLQLKEPVEVPVPREPSRPKKIFESSRYIQLKYGHEYSIKKLQSLLPEGVSLNDVRIKRSSSDNGCDVVEYISIYYMVRKDNPDYKEQMVLYRKLMKAYKKDSKEYPLKREKYIGELKEYFDSLFSIGVDELHMSYHLTALKEKYQI